MISKMKINLILSLCLISLISIGFSSWYISEDDNGIYGSLDVDNVGEIDLNESIYYINGSEDGFDYYIFDNKYYFTKTSYSIKIKINPKNIEQKLSNYGMLFVTFGISYTTTLDYDIFSENNPFAISPKYVVYSLNKVPSFCIKSNECVANVKTNENGTKTYSLFSTIPLYDTINPSLYSLAKKYQKGTEYIYINASYDFEILDNFIINILNFESVNMNFHISLDGTRS